MFSPNGRLSDGFSPKGPVLVIRATGQAHRETFRKGAGRFKFLPNLSKYSRRRFTLPPVRTPTSFRDFQRVYKHVRKPTGQSTELPSESTIVSRIENEQNPLCK